jgi:hypothetical protein
MFNQVGGRWWVVVDGGDREIDEVYITGSSRSRRRDSSEYARVCERAGVKERGIW